MGVVNMHCSPTPDTALSLSRLLTAMERELHEGRCGPSIAKDVRALQDEIMRTLEHEGWSFCRTRGRIKVRHPEHPKPFRRRFMDPFAMVRA
jgi:hypothetical protein